LLRTAGLLVFAAVVASTFWLAARTTGGVDRQHRRQLPELMAHSLIPIVIGYVFAHYLTYLVERGQQTIILLLGLNTQVHYVQSLHPSVLATIKVGRVLAGHVCGVIAAHDRAAVVAGPVISSQASWRWAGHGRLHVHGPPSIVRRVRTHGVAVN
jgi:hypothetical protein